MSAAVRLRPAAGRVSRLAGKQSEQTADRLRLRGMAIGLLRIFLEIVPRTLAHGVLKRRHRIGRPDMRLAAHTKHVFAADFGRIAQRIVAEASAWRAPSLPLLSSPTPSIVVAVPKKYLSTKSDFSPIASKIWAPQ
jgi:hypothetical protein